MQTRTFHFAFECRESTASVAMKQKLSVAQFLNLFPISAQLFVLKEERDVTHYSLITFLKLIVCCHSLLIPPIIVFGTLFVYF